MAYDDYRECPYLITSGWFGLTYRCQQDDNSEVSKWQYEDYCRENSRYKTEDCKHYGNNGSVCFITMSCIKKALGNSCLELENLRTFRDSYMLSREDGKDFVSTYYKTSPKIVKAINRDSKREIVWNEIFKYVSKANTIIEENKTEVFNMYKEMMVKLCERYKIPLTY